MEEERHSLENQVKDFTKLIEQKIQENQKLTKDQIQLEEELNQLML